MSWARACLDVPRGIRRITDFYDRSPDRLSRRQIEDYFCDLVKNHSWSTVKVDRNGLQFFFKHVLRKDWDWVDIVKPPKSKVLPEILTAHEIEKVIYGLMFKCAESTIKDLGRNHKKLSAELGMTVVLPTHTCRLDYHPHIYLIVPAGGINRTKSQWREMPGKYLFNGRALSTVFRGRMLAALQRSGLTPDRMPKRWVAQCQHVGNGLPALKYLSRYLYRGVISDQNIINDDGDNATFRCWDSSRKTETRNLPGEEFVALLLQHTLPKGFRRVRDYGFLYGNAKRLLRVVQWILRVSVPQLSETPRPKFTCQHCLNPMLIVKITRHKQAPG